MLLFNVLGLNQLLNNFSLIYKKTRHVFAVMLDAYLYYGNNFRGLYEWLTWYAPLLNLANNLSTYVDWVAKHANEDDVLWYNRKFQIYIIGDGWFVLMLWHYIYVYTYKRGRVHESIATWQSDEMKRYFVTWLLYFIMRYIYIYIYIYIYVLQPKS